MGTLAFDMIKKGVRVGIHGTVWDCDINFQLCRRLSYELSRPGCGGGAGKKSMPKYRTQAEELHIRSKSEEVALRTAPPLPHLPPVRASSDPPSLVS